MDHQRPPVQAIGQWGNGESRRSGANQHDGVWLSLST
jgi:hypothetical protein